MAQGPQSSLLAAKWTSSLLVVLAVCSIPASLADGEKKMICYYTYWSLYRPGIGEFVPEDVDPFVCTHVIYAFASINGNQLTTFDGEQDLYTRITNLKQTNPALKVMLSLGGWNMGSAPFLNITISAKARQWFAVNIVRTLRKYNFDGFDLDWEYPDNARTRHKLLVRDIRRMFEYEALMRQRTRLILGAAISADIEKIKNRYDIPSLSNDLDLWNIMAYDLNGGWSDHIGHQSGIVDQQYIIDEYVKRGVPKENIMMGIPTYGRVFQLTDSSLTVPGSPNSGAGNAGAYTQEAGVHAYYEICPKLKRQGWQVYYDDTQKVSYTYSGDQWISYEDHYSASIKAQYILDENLGGALIWSLDLDDFDDHCGEGTIIQAIKDVFDAGVNTRTTTTTLFPPTAGSTTTGATVVGRGSETQLQVTCGETMVASTKSVRYLGVDLDQSLDDNFICEDPNGLYPFPGDCNAYYHCAFGTPIKKYCQTNLVFNPRYNGCDFPANVAGC